MLRILHHVKCIRLFSHRLNESNDILKQQVKLKEDMFDIQQKKNKKILYVFY